MSSGYMGLCLPWIHYFQFYAYNRLIKTKDWFLLCKALALFLQVVNISTWSWVGFGPDHSLMSWTIESVLDQTIHECPRPLPPQVSFGPDHSLMSWTIESVLDQTICECPRPFPQSQFWTRPFSNVLDHSHHKVKFGPDHSWMSQAIATTSQFWTRPFLNVLDH